MTTFVNRMTYLTNGEYALECSVWIKKNTRQYSKNSSNTIGWNNQKTLTPYWPFKGLALHEWTVHKCSCDKITSILNKPVKRMIYCGVKKEEKKLFSCVQCLCVCVCMCAPFRWTVSVILSWYRKHTKHPELLQPQPLQKCQLEGKTTLTEWTVFGRPLLQGVKFIALVGDDKVYWFHFFRQNTFLSHY